MMLLSTITMQMRPLSKRTMTNEVAKYVWNANEAAKHKIDAK